MFHQKRTREWSQFTRSNVKIKEANDSDLIRYFLNLLMEHSELAE